MEPAVDFSLPCLRGPSRCSRRREKLPGPQRPFLPPAEGSSTALARGAARHEPEEPRPRIHAQGCLRRADASGRQESCKPRARSRSETPGVPFQMSIAPPGYPTDETDPGSGSRQADDNVQYEFKSVQALRGRESSAKAKWQNQGWEFVSENRGTLRTELNFRRVKPKTLGAHLAEHRRHLPTIAAEDAVGLGRVMRTDPGCGHHRHRCRDAKRRRHPQTERGADHGFDARIRRRPASRTDGHRHHR